MANILGKILMIVVGGEFVIGILGNAFIGLIYCIAWIRSQKLCLIDFLLISLTCARFSLLCLITVNFYSLLTSGEIFDFTKLEHGRDILWMLANHSNIWFAACVAVFYFLKISRFSYPLFLWLRWRINKVIFLLLLASVPFLIVSIALPYGFQACWYCVLDKSNRNLTKSLDEIRISNLNSLISGTVLSFPPICLSSICFSLLLLSLQRHTKYVEQNARGSKDPSTVAHFTAMRTVFFFLVLFTLYQLALLMTFAGHYFIQNRLIVMFGFLIGLLYPSAHSYVVIFGNTQMRTAFLGMFWYLKHGLKRMALSAT